MNEELKSIHPRRKKCCGGLFADDVVLIAPSCKKFRKIIKKRYINRQI